MEQEEGVFWEGDFEDVRAETKIERRTESVVFIQFIGRAGFCGSFFFDLRLKITYFHIISLRVLQKLQ